MIKRSLVSQLQRRLGSKKPILLLGPCRSGKSILIKEAVSILDPDFETWDCADPGILKKIIRAGLTEMKQLINEKKTIFINSAHRIPDFKNKLQQISDLFTDIQLIIASSFDSDMFLVNKIHTGSTELQYFLYPVSWQEYSEYEGFIDSKRELESRLIYGMYPEVLVNPGKESDVLQKLYDDYLYENIFSATAIRKPSKLKKLFQELALNIGKEISLNQLSDIIKVDKNTVNSYINLLEKSFVVFKLQALSRNHIHEVKSSVKIYFYDNGIRNAAISNFNPLNMRHESEALWENFCISERRKFLYYRQKQCSSFFWRTTGQKKVDYIEEYEDGLHAYEFIWNRQSDKFFSKTFLKAYPACSTDIISPANFAKFIGSAKIK